MNIARLKRRAFSLAELVTVIALMGIIAAIALPRYSAALCNYRVNAAARRLTADLVYAQSLAKSTSSSCTVTFNTVNNSYVLFGGSSGGGFSANSPTAYSVSLAADPFDSTISLANQSSPWTVSFNGYGIPSSGGMIVLQCGTAQKTVTIDSVNGVVGQ